jgi:MFS family permease
MNGNQYNIALSVFFIPYVLAGELLKIQSWMVSRVNSFEEVPSNMILNRLRRPSRYLGALIFLWGIIMTCTGFVKNFADLVVIRFLLGLFE